jgi:hypothetical protein
MTAILNSLESSQAEKLVDALYARATDKLNFITSCFDYIAPECTYDTPGCFDAPNIIAFGPGTRIRNGVSNQSNISVAQVRQELIAAAINQFGDDPAFNEKTPEEQTKIAIERIWPKATSGTRERERNDYNSHAVALFAYAESLMTKDIRSIINQFDAYTMAKSKRCVIGFLEAIRTRCANGTTNKEVNRESIEAAIRDLDMGDSIDSYTDYKNTFIRHISNLKKCIGDGQFNEGVYVSKFLSRLNQDLFDKIYLKRVSIYDNEIKLIPSLERAYAITEEMFNAIKLYQTETQKKRKIKHDETASTGEKDSEANCFSYDHDKKKKNNNNNNNNNNNKGQYKNNLKKKGGDKDKANDKKDNKGGKDGARHQSVCMFYDPDDPTKCKYGDKCKKKHIEDKALLAEFRKINEERNKFFAKI